MLRFKPAPEVSLIRTVVWISSRGRCMASLRKTRCSSWKEFSIRLVQFDALWQAIRVQELRKTIKQQVFHFGYPKMQFMTHISESIRRMGSSDNYTTDISEWLHIGNVKNPDRSTTKVNYIQQMLKHNDRCTSFEYMAETLSYHALQGWYNIDSANIFNLLSAADKWRNTCRAYLLHLHHWQKEPFSPYHTRNIIWENLTSVACAEVFKLTSLRNGSVDSRIPNIWQLFRAQIEDNFVYEISGLVLRYDQNVVIDSIFIQLQNGLLYYCQPFHCPTSVERLGLDCKVEYTDANQEIMSESHNIWVQYTDSDLNNTFQGWVPSFPVLSFSWTPLNQIL